MAGISVSSAMACMASSYSFLSSGMTDLKKSVSLFGKIG